MSKQDQIIDAIRTVTERINILETRLDNNDRRFHNLGLRLDAYDRIFNSFDDVPESVLDASKVIHDYCHSMKSCGSCKFYVNGACIFIHAPCVWHMGK